MLNHLSPQQADQNFIAEFRKPHWGLWEALILSTLYNTTSSSTPKTYEEEEEEEKEEEKKLTPFFILSSSAGGYLCPSWDSWASPCTFSQASGTWKRG